MHYLIFVGLILLGTLLRFWNLDAKPLWMDEVITAIFSFGRSYQVVPLEKFFPVAALDRVFSFDPTATCTSITQTISTQSVHPPLFFCWLHGWLALLQPLELSWVWKIRSLPAIAGVLMIVAMYILNRTAFSKNAGLLGALAIAVSPFAVYLSQEARHYTVPMLLILVALLGLVRIQQDLQQQSLRVGVWMGWIIANGIGFYVHYFFILAVVAQILTLIGLQFRREIFRRNVQKRLIMEGLSDVKELTWFSWKSWGAIALSISGIGLCYFPWLPTFMSHISRPETDWLATGQSGWLSWIAPLYQLTAGWLVMAIALPVEQQDLWIAIPCGVLMLLLGGWLAWMVIKGLRQLLRDPKTHWETLTLMSFVGWSLTIFLAIVYILRKDITQVPRYNFIYFPAVVALVGASLWASLKTRRKQRQALIILVASVVSSVCVISNLVFLKPYLPDQVAANILAPQGSSRVVMAYDDLQDIALGLSFALTLRKENRVQFSFIRKAQGYESVWQKLFALNSKQNMQRFWMIAPGLRKADFPTQLSIAKSTCQINPDRYYRIGIPYQGYDCKN